MAKPAILPHFATITTAGYPGRVQPNSGKLDAGYQDDESPPAGEHNWLFGVNADWIAFLAAGRDAAMSRMRDATMNPPAVGAAVGGLAATGGPLTGIEVEGFAIAPSSNSNVNSTIIVAGYLSAGPAALFAATTDLGSNWSLVNAAPFTGRFAAIEHANGLWVAVGQNGEIQTSSDGGVTFVQRLTGVSGNHFAGVAYNAANGEWVAAASGGVSYRSADGLSWSSIASGPVSASDIAAGGGVFVCATASGLLQSVDGSSGSWTPVTAAAGEGQTDSQSMTAVAYTGLIDLPWVAVRQTVGGPQTNSVYVADDLSTGFVRKTVLQVEGAFRVLGATVTPWGAVVFGEHTSNVVRSCWTSTDGTNWNRLFLPPAIFGGDQGLKDIEFLWDDNRQCGALWCSGGGFAVDIARGGLVSL